MCANPRSPDLRILAAIPALSVLASCQTVKRYVMPTDSMEPTINKGERFTVDLNAYKERSPMRGDVVVLVDPTGGELVVKRVIGVEGDTLEGKGLDVLRNGERLKEPYIEHKGRHPGALDNFGPLRVTKATIFVMGDNRDFSFDSRMHQFGLVKLDAIRGRALATVGSDDPNRIGTAIQ